MSLFTWCSRRSGGLAMIALLALCYWVISKEAAVDILQDGLDHRSLQSPRVENTGAGYWTVTFAYYSLFIHILVFTFPLRANWSIWDLTRSLKKTAHQRMLRDFKPDQHRRGSATSLSSSDTLTSPAAYSDVGDLEQGFGMDGTAESNGRVVHAIVIPNYKEEMDTLRETLEVLASHPGACDSYDVYLAMEQREENAETKALSLISEFGRQFRCIEFTMHPPDIPGESAGKGSNMAWAARKLSENYPISGRKDVVITGMDADSHLSSNYFSSIAAMHLAYPETATTTLYAAPIIFDRNAHSVPAIVRVADILWCAAGMSGLYRGSTIAPPTSVYSLPLTLADRVGGWDCDPEAIGEDLHMYLKCFFALNGSLTVRTVLSPVSQTNVTGGSGKGFGGMLKDVRARYKQAMRHMWGALDTGYALRKVVELWKERKRTSRAFRPLHTSLNNAPDAYIPHDQLQNPGQPAESGIFSDVTHDTLKEPDYTRIFWLFHRLFEAHFLPVHMTILVIASTLFVWVTEGNPDVHGINWIFDVCNVLRTLGFMEIALYLFLYEGFHRICVAAREREMSEAGLSKGMHFSYRSVRKNYIDYIMVPLVAPLYGAIPCAQAQISHFWTLDLVYSVSKKVTRQRVKSQSAAALA